MNKSYDKLKTDKMADEGKKLYQSGKTITSNNNKFLMTEAGIVVGANVTSAILAQYGSLKVAAIGGPAIAMGGTIVNSLLAARTNSQNKKLRAYYAH